MTKAAKKNAKRREKKKQEQEMGGGGGGEPPVNAVTQSVRKLTVTNHAEPQQSTETNESEKRLKNLKKKMKQIEGLERKIQSGEVKNPEKDQLEKVAKKKQILEEIEDLELELGLWLISL